MGKLRSKLLQARLCLRVLSDFGSQFLIGFFCLRGTPRNSQLESVVETPQLRFVFFLVTDVQCNTEKVRRRSVFEIGLAPGRNPALVATSKGGSRQSAPVRRTRPASIARSEARAAVRSENPKRMHKSSTVATP